MRRAGSGAQIARRYVMNNNQCLGLIWLLAAVLCGASVGAAPSKAKPPLGEGPFEQLVDDFVFGTLALVVGFSVLAMSRFIPLVYFGVLVSLAMLGGLIGNLLLLPLLLPLVDKDPQQPEQNPGLSASET